MISDVETELRATLVEAESDAPAPSDLAERLIAGSTDPRRTAGRDRRWLPPLLAAAAVVAVLVGVTLVVRGTGSTPPVHRRSPSVHTSPAPPTPSAGVLTPLRCVTALPSGWQTARATATATSIAAPSLLYGDIAMDGLGRLLAVQYTASHAYRVLLLRHGSQPRTLYETRPGQPSPEQAMAIRSLVAEGQWAALTVVEGHRAKIVLIDLTGDTYATVRTIPSGFDMLSDARVVADGAADSGLTIADGSLYWAEIGAGRQQGRMYRFDIATGRLHMVDSAVASGPSAVVGATVYWQSEAGIGTWPRGAVVPPGVDWTTHPALAGTSDGDLVWQARSGAIEAQRPGGARTGIVPAGRGWQLAAVTGDFVLAENNRGVVVVDLRTGAAARWGAADDRVAYSSPTAVVLSSKDGFDVVDATSLPSLSC